MTGPQGSAVLAVLLSFPVAMALATGTEAPATAIGQLGQLGAIRPAAVRSRPRSC